MKKLCIAILCSITVSSYASKNKIEKVYYTPKYTIIVSSTQPATPASRAAKQCTASKVACFKPERPVARALRRLP